MRYKFGAAALFRGSLVLPIKQKEETGLKTNKWVTDWPEWRDTIVVVKSYTTLLLATLFNLVSFIMIFLGLFMIPGVNEGQNTFTMFYYEIVTLYTLGYGDVLFTLVPGRALTCIFIIVSLTYIPVAVFGVIDVLKEALPEIDLKSSVSNGIVIIGKFNKAFAITAREVISDDLEIAYIIPKQQLSDEEKTVNSEVGGF